MRIVNYLWMNGECVHTSEVVSPGGIKAENKVHVRMRGDWRCFASAFGSPLFTDPQSEADSECFEYKYHTELYIEDYPGRLN